MSSREEFMRQMGLTATDLKVPAEPSVPSRSAKSRPAAAAASPAASRAQYEETSSSPLRGAPQPSAKSGMSQSKADFLRSLGIDNYNDDLPPAPATSAQPSSAQAARNATGSQQYPRSEHLQRNDSSTLRGAATQQSSGSFNAGGSQRRRFGTEEDEEESSFRGAYTPKLREPQRDDLTLGRKPVLERAPAMPALEAELLGLSEGAGVEEVKNMGNKFFQAGDYRKAVRLYTRAIELDGMNSALYSNRSAAYLLGGKQMGIDTRSMALRDAEKAIKLKPTWFKGYSRRGDALFKMERYEEAYEAYQSALELDAGNSGIIHSMNELKPHLKHSEKRSTESVSWAAPGNTILHSSVASQSGMRTTEKSAYELLNEFHQERERTTPHLGLGGSDYKVRELEKYRTRGDSGSYTTSQEYDSAPQQQASSGNKATPSLATSAKRGELPSEFSSDAAKEYQATLLESYRKKKQQQQQGGRRA